jgi:hypothetical protein
MSKLQIHIKGSKIVGTTLTGMKPKKVSGLEKLRRSLTRKRNFKQAWKNLNSPIIYPKIKD